jgi:hypothetical protein
MLKWLSNYICLYGNFEKMGHHELFYYPSNEKQND